MLAPIANKAAISPINIDKLRRPGHQRKLPSDGQDTIEISQEARELAGTARGGHGPATHEPAPPAPPPLVQDPNPLPPLQDPTRVTEVEAIQESTLQRPMDAVSGSRRADPIDQAPPALTTQERAQVRALERQDQQIRAHEHAHLRASGGHAAGPPSYKMQVGPDGRRYAVGGHVRIDATPVQGNPEATITKMQDVRRAALAPANPSAQDRRVASEAARYEQEARAQMAAQRAERTSEFGRGAETAEAMRPGQAQDDRDVFAPVWGPRAAMAFSALLEATEPDPVSIESTISARDLDQPEG